jgi:hypothetical protein
MDSGNIDFLAGNEGMMEDVDSPIRRGRPRSEKVHQAIMVAALEEVFAVGFRALSIDAIAAKAGVGKTTIYRRWPNKAAVVMDAFFGPGFQCSRSRTTSSARDRGHQAEHRRVCKHDNIPSRQLGPFPKHL